MFKPISRELTNQQGEELTAECEFAGVVVSGGPTSPVYQGNADGKYDLMATRRNKQRFPGPELPHAIAGTNSDGMRFTDDACELARMDARDLQVVPHSQLAKIPDGHSVCQEIIWQKPALALAMSSISLHNILVKDICVPGYCYLSARQRQHTTLSSLLQDPEPYSFACYGSLLVMLDCLHAQRISDAFQRSRSLGVNGFSHKPHPQHNGDFQLSASRLSKDTGARGPGDLPPLSRGPVTTGEPALGRGANMLMPQVAMRMPCV